MGEFDYVIVGSGSGGALLAHRVSEDERVSVCILEAGGGDYHPFIHIPVGFIRMLNSSNTMWKYRTEPSEATANRTIEIPQGKVLGGSSAINGMIYNRGQAADYDEWAALGNIGWGFEDVLPYFKRSESWTGVPQSESRGTRGPLTVCAQPWRIHLGDVYVEAAREIGVPDLPDYNGGGSAGVGYYQRTVRGRVRDSAASAFLRPLGSRRNVRLIKCAEVRTILFDGKKAVGVTFRRPDGSAFQIRARREVILSAGTVGTTRLLQHNGIGNDEVLKRAGVEVFHSLKGVGGNFRDHYAIRIVSRVKNTRTINEIARGPRLWWEAVKWMAGRNSVLGLGPSLIHVLWKSDEGMERPDLQCSFMPGSYRMGHLGALDDFSGMTCGIFQQRPASHGHIHIQSPHWQSAPLVQPNYLHEDEDTRAVLGGLKLVRRLMATKALAPYNAGEIFPGPQISTDEDVLAFARANGGTAYHLIGTSSMGPASDPSAVVSPELLVHGLSGLRIVDASVMPRMPSGNVNAPTMMIAEKAADLIRSGR